MYRRLLSISLIICVMYLVIGCVTSEKQIKEMSPDEQAISQLLDNMVNAWNNKDVAGYLSAWHDDAKMMIGKEKAIVSKKEFSKTLPAKIGSTSDWKFKSKKIKINDDKATVKARTLYGGVLFYYYFNLAKENGKWFIMSDRW